MLTAELECLRCSGDYCTHLYNMRKNLFSAFRKRFVSRSDVDVFLKLLINSHLFLQRPPSLVLSEFAELRVQIRSQPEVIWQDPRMKSLLPVFVWNSLVQSELELAESSAELAPVLEGIRKKYNFEGRF